MNYRKSKLIQCVALSIALHLILSAGFFAHHPPQIELNDSPLEFEINEPGQKTSQDFVTDPDLNRLQESLKRLEDKAKFLSRTTQRVRDQQVARKVDQTRNRSQQEQPRSESREIDLNKTPLETTDGISDFSQQNNRQLQVQLEESAISEYIPEVKQGGFTSLNTDQFIFYTFYARINEQIRNRWVQNIRDFTNQNPPMVLDRLSRANQVTEIEVLLNSEGNYVKSIIHRKADHPGLDQAVAKSFVMAQPFQNPPLEIVEKDGYIHLRYSFHLTWSPRSMASGSR